MKLNLKDIDAVYKKIDKKLDELLRENDYMSAFDLLDIAINRAPSVPAVPLEPLCEWLETNARLVRPDGARGDLDWLKWKEELTKWMEGLE